MAFDIEKQLQEIAENVRFLKNHAVHSDDFNDLKKEVSVIKHQIGDLDSKIDNLGDKIVQVCAGVEKTADILQEKQIITEPEKKMIYNSASPFVMPA